MNRIRLSSLLKNEGTQNTPNEGLENYSTIGFTARLRNWQEEKQKSQNQDALSYHLWGMLLLVGFISTAQGLTVYA